MGLLGGFKGKLIGREKKEKKFPPARIVCVKYNTFSEFESPSEIPSCSNANPGRNDVIRERRKHSKPEIKNVFAGNGAIPNNVAKPAPKPSNGEAAKPSRGEAPKPSKEAAKPPKPSHGETAKPSRGEAPKPSKEAAKPPKPSHGEAAKPSKGEAPKPTKEAAKPPKEAAKPPKPSNGEAAQPSKAKPPMKKAAPQPSTNTSKLTKAKAPELPPTPTAVKKPPEPILTVNDDDSPIVLKGPKLFSLPNDTDSEDDVDGNFKIHIAQNHKTTNFGDEDSSSEDEALVEPAPIDFSSQAASIFFGEMEEPTVRRPRNIIVNEDDGNSSEGSSASA